MTGSIVRVAFVAALAPLLFGAAPAPRPSDAVAWQVFAKMVAPANARGVKAVAFETWASEEDIYTPPGPRWPGATVAKQLHRALNDALPGLTLQEVQSAVTAGYAALAAFNKQMQGKGREILHINIIFLPSQACLFPYCR